MRNIWKSVLGVALIAAISSGAAVGASTYLMNKNQRPAELASGIENTFKQPYRLTNYGTVAAENIDFTTAAESAAHGVVHIKTMTNAQASNGDGGRQCMDPFEYFFGFGGHGGFQRPQQQPRMSAGSGVIISTDGYIIMNNHVIDGADELEVTLDGNRKFPAKVIRADPTADIVLIKIEATDLPTIPFGDSEKLKIGEWMLAVGNPFSLTSTITIGIVSAKSRSNIDTGGKGRSKTESFIQTDAAMNLGNSGGALVNTKGELIGINTAIYSETGNFAGYSFAVPTNIAGRVVNDLRQFGTVQRAVLGVLIQDPQYVLNAEKEKVKVFEGTYVGGFAERSSAKEAGVEKGDVIVAVNGVKIKSSSALQEQIGKCRPGDKVGLTINRNGSTKKFTVELRNAQGSTKVVKGDDSAEVMGVAFKALDDEQKRGLGVNYGIEITNPTSGKLKDADIKKNFIIMIVNNQKISAPKDLEEIVESIPQGRTEDQGLLIKGFYPGGHTKYYAIGLTG